MTSTPVQQNCDSRSPGGREASALPAVRGVSGKAVEEFLTHRLQVQN